MKNNIETIQQIYACFGTGDIPGILDRLTEDATFEHNGKFPWSGRFEGKSNIATFFQLLGANAAVTAFLPSNFRMEGTEVVNDCRFEAVAATNGKPFGYDLTMSWNFDEQGNPTSYIGLADESQLPAAEACYQ